MIIDDDPTFVEFCAAHLARRFEVHVAFSGSEGMRKLSALLPEAVLLDLRMPRVSGLEVLRYMQTLPELRSIPVAVITASAVDAKLKEFLKSQPNVCKTFPKTASLNSITKELTRDVVMGSLYRTTPRLVEDIHNAERIIGNSN